MRTIVDTIPNTKKFFLGGDFIHTRELTPNGSCLKLTLFNFYLNTLKLKQLLSYGFFNM